MLELVLHMLSKVSLLVKFRQVYRLLHVAGACPGHAPKDGQRGTVCVASSWGFEAPLRACRYWTVTVSMT